MSLNVFNARVEEGEIEGEGEEEYEGVGEDDEEDTEKEMASLMEKVKIKEKKEKAADLVSKLRGKKKANKKIMPYEIYATSGE